MAKKAKKAKSSAARRAEEVVEILKSIDARLEGAIKKAGLAPKVAKPNAEPRKEISFSDMQRAAKEKRRREARGERVG